MSLNALMLAALLGAGRPNASFGAEQAAWGWKAEELDRYRQPQTPAENGWRPVLMTAPAAAFPVAPPAPEPGKEAKAATPARMPESAKAYCQNIENAALDVRFLHQKAELQRLEEELAKRTSLLEEKRAEYQAWLKRRDEFIGKAEGSLVELYSKMKPDAAALQLAAIDEEAAAALLLRLGARSSSAILNQMESAKAARLVSVMIGAAKPPEKAPAPPALGEGPGKEQATGQAAEKRL